MALSTKVFATVQVKIDPDMHVEGREPLDERDEFAWAYLDTAMRLIEAAAARMSGQDVDAAGNYLAARHVHAAYTVLAEGAE